MIFARPLGIFAILCMLGAASSAALDGAWIGHEYDEAGGKSWEFTCVISGKSGYMMHFPDGTQRRDFTADRYYDGESMIATWGDPLTAIHLTVSSNRTSATAMVFWPSSPQMFYYLLTKAPGELALNRTS